MNVILIVGLIVTTISSIIFIYLYLRLSKKHHDTNFTPFFMGRITPFTRENEEALSINKA